MVFKLNNDVSLESANKTRNIKKIKNFTNKVVFVNGFAASGKTMLAPIISSMDRTEQLVYPYEIQWLSSFFYASKIDENSFIEFLKMHADNTTYNSLMGRNSNFRYSDISSVLQSKNKFEYIKRIFQKGDNFVLPKIKSENPIINYVTTDMFFFINEIGKAFSDRVLFIETVRDPMYMFLQAKIKQLDYKQNLTKNFSFSVFEKDHSSFWFDYYSKTDQFNSFEEKILNKKIIDYFTKIFNFYFNFNFEEIEMNKGKFLILPFEKFVLQPDKWIDKILETLNIEKSQKLKKEMIKQKVPRKFLHDGYERTIYKKYKQYPIDKKYNSFEEADQIYKEKIKLEFTNNDIHLFENLLKLSNQYRNWIKKFDNKILFN